MAYEQQVPALAPDWDPTESALTPAEGFLLSRIDGRTPWSQLRLIAGIPPAEVDRCLQRWLSEGVVTVQGVNGAADSAPGSVETAIGLSPEQQRQILEFEASLDRPYHQILGVDRGADAKAIKRAYFLLSKKFHPDRYFRVELGSFGPRLERIFRKVIEAYELLSDPATRAEIERSLDSAAQPGSRPAASEAPSPSGGAKTPPPISSRRAALEGLRRHFRIPEKVMKERRFKARQFYQSAMIAAKKGRWLEAGASIRLSIAFDPFSDEYKHSFAAIQSQVHQLRADELLRDAQASLDAKSQQAAMRMYEEALSYRPCDPEINVKAAELALELGDLEAAREYAEAACELVGESAREQRLLGRILVRAGIFDKAIEALERALAADPGDASIRAELANVKKRRPRNR